MVDLNRKSTDYLNKIGAVNAHKYNLVADDNTHVIPAGGKVFGNLVSVLLGALGNGKGAVYAQWSTPGMCLYSYVDFACF